MAHPDPNYRPIEPATAALAPAGVVHPHHSTTGHIIATTEVVERGQPVTLARFEEDSPERLRIWVPLSSLSVES